MSRLTGQEIGKGYDFAYFAWMRLSTSPGVRMTRSVELTASRQPRKIDDRYERVTLAEIATPVNGATCRVNYWWHVTADDCVLFFRYRGGATPQCNPDKAVLDYCQIEGTRPVQIPVAFIPARYDRG